ncbi:hypothetical protein Hte_011463 [Hypoxylon texense]
MPKSNSNENLTEEAHPRPAAASPGPMVKSEPDGHLENDSPIMNSSSDFVIFSNLRQAPTIESAETLDSYKAIGFSVLDDLKDKLERMKGSRKAIDHTKAIRDLKEQAQTRKTILGVVGSTGQGKSSLINALLGERKLVPTNCVRACTAVITEISWNSSKDPDQQYIAEIEFISRDEWSDELEIVFRDLRASQDETPGAHIDGDADVKIALAKVNTVYPNITNAKDLAQTDVGSLLSDSTVNEYLGTTKVIYGSAATTFNRDVAHYIDSLQKGSISEDIKEDGDRGEKQDRMQLWPLIKVVRIYTKADALSTGAVIVDLPGIEDSNAARAAVAAKYIEKCNAIWVVAAITRAVNDKTAQKLLGQSFKQQLNYDGNYSRVTFVCSKTDDITMVEAAESLGLKRELDNFYDKEAAVQDWQNKGMQQLDNDESRSKSLYSYIGELDRQLSQWEKLETRQREGDTVTTSQLSSKKRKASAQTFRTSKRQKGGISTSSNGSLQYTSAGEFWNNLESGMPIFPENAPLNEEQIRSVIGHLRAKKDTALQEREKLDEKIDKAAEASGKLEEDYEKAKSHLLSSTIRERSSYTRKHMRRDFAEGLKQLDQENLLHENTGDTVVTFRDYDKLSKSLNVFCVSSKAYQGLSKRLGTSSGTIEGFESPEDTEIPQLIAHTKKLTESIRLESNKSFLNGLLQVLHSLYMWCDAHSNGLGFSDKEKQRVMDDVKDALLNLDQDLTKSVDVFVQKCKNVLTGQLFTKLDISVTKAVNEAPKIAGKWPRLKGGDEGLPFASYKAACRREGVYSGKTGKCDFNEDLVRPFRQGLANDWVRAFQQKIPEALGEFTRTSEQLLEGFHEVIKARIQKKASFATINALRSQLRARALGVTHMVNSFGSDIVTLQREASRKTNPSIKEGMKGTYSACVGESGPGCFLRIQNRMQGDLETNGESLFKAAIDPVKRDLTSLCERLESGLRAKIADMLDGMNQDYANVIIGQEVDEGIKEGAAEILKLLKEVDQYFDYKLEKGPDNMPEGDSQLLF